MAAGLYSTGTIAVSNGSAAVTGTGTAWVGNVSPGSMIIMPNGETYFVQAVVSNTSLTLSRTYAGTSQTGQSYDIAPTGGVTAALVARVQELITQFADIANNAGTGKFGDGTLGAPGMSFLSDQDSGIRRIASNALALVAGGVDQLALQGGVASGAAVQSSMNDATIGKLLKVGAAATVLAGGLEKRLTAGGSANTIALSTGASLAALPIGYRVRWRAGSTNTGATTINLDGLGAIAARTITGVALPAGYIRADADTTAYYDGTNWIVDRVAERGINANGGYERLANGTQRCWHMLTLPAPNVADGAIFSTGSGVTWVYPITFASGTYPTVVGSSKTTGGLLVSAFVSGNTSASIRVSRATSSGATPEVDTTAIGHWY